MEIRVLRYFLAVAREGSFSSAAESLHLSQPTLSRQLKDLEEQLGKQLFIRGNRKVTLTEEGLLLRKRAQEIIELAKKTESEISCSDKFIGGDIYIGGGETKGMRLVAKAVRALREDFPHIHVHLFNGNVDDVSERLDKGLLDFGVFIEPADIGKYEFLKLPVTHKWGVIMRKDNPLAPLKAIKPKDLHGLPIMTPSREIVLNKISGWMGGIDKLNVVATFNLIFNAAFLIEEGVGCAVCIDGLVDISEKSALCFRPLEPKMEVGMNIAWKKHQVFSKVAEEFLARMQKERNG